MTDNFLRFAIYYDRSQCWFPAGILCVCEPFTLTLL